MPVAGMGGSPVPVPVTERLTKLGIKVFRSYGSTEHPSITGCLLGIGFRRPAVTVASFVVWARLTGAFIARRLRGTVSRRR